MKYSDGTVNVTNGSNSVVGVGTLFSANVAAGQLFTIIGSGITNTIASVTDNTHLVLVSNYAGATSTGNAYTIIQGFTTGYGIPYPDIGDVQTATIMKRAMVLIDTLFSAVFGTSATTTQLVDKTNTVNTTYKKAGRSIFNTTTGKPVWAVGSNATDVWKDATGATAHTPV